MLNFSSEDGMIIVDDAVIAKIVSEAANESFGVAGMAAKNIGEGILGFFKIDRKDKGVHIDCTDNKVSIDLHIMVTYGINIPAISESIIHKVVYTVEQMLDIKVNDINIYVDGVTK